MITFKEFCQEVTEFYKQDKVKPGLYLSLLPADEPDPDKPDKKLKGERWYLAVHRYPGRVELEKIFKEELLPSTAGMQRFVSVQYTGESGDTLYTDLNELHRDWLSVRDFDVTVETARHKVLYAARKEAAKGKA